MMDSVRRLHPLLLLLRHPRRLPLLVMCLAKRLPRLGLRLLPLSRRSLLWLRQNCL